MVSETPRSGARTHGGINVVRLLSHLGANPAAVAYAMTTLGAGMMNSIFSFYYVKLFLNKYRISEGAFHQSQVVYMIWNAVNDPLFGYIQDNSRVACCSRRRLSILYGAPLYSLAFLLAWFPWRSYSPGDWLSGLHLTVALCAFDGLLTFVLLAQCALFAEISGHHQSRLRLIKYNQVASLIGSSSVLFCGLFSRNMEDYSAFQSVTVVVAVLACGCMLYTGFHSESRFDNKGSGTSSPSSSTTEVCGNQASGQPALSFSSVVSMTWQILTDPNFQLFVLMNFFQVFMLAFFNNFTMIFTEHLIPPNVLPPLAKSVMYGAGFICPQILVLSSQKLLLELGYYKMILYTFYVEVAMAAVMLVLGPQHHYILAVFLTANMVIIQAAFSLFNLPLADIIDSDLQKYKRSSPLSSMVFGTNALFTKPAQSLAPMLVVTILNQFRYEDLKDITKASDPEAVESLHSIMFYLVCLIPLFISTAQALVWRPFSIRNSHTVDTKYLDG
ncbi:Transmembrane protein 180 [Merluccius polli]|uniref:Transmembrane protein 180 n=1 Tax=Merluccius polli TaxID=89951 RepID=A0AA47NW58_MERPO|nr:Transmembrane protein 180 [Merluccius polli]